MLSSALFATAGLLLGLIAGILVARRRERAGTLAVQVAREEADTLLARATLEAESLRREGELAGREASYRLREEWEHEEGRRRKEVERLERRQVNSASALSDRAERADRRAERLRERESSLDGRARSLDARESQANRTESELREHTAELDRKQADLDRLVMEHFERGTRLEEREGRVRKALEEIAELSAEEAKQTLVEMMREEARLDAEQSLREIVEQARADGEDEARKIITAAIQRMAAECTAESTVSVVELPSDEMKGRIIGREGRNIRSFEKETGVNVIIDDTPGAVVLSCFEPRRREVARIALERLVEDGRIHPSRIEDQTRRARVEIEKTMREAASEVMRDLGITGVPHEIHRRLGMLHFRTSFGQNQLQHSMEVAWLAGTMATELGLNVELAKRAGLLHDIGKGFPHHKEGTHVELGYRLCKRQNEHPIVLNAIKAHHDEEDHLFPETFLVTAADAISGSRPGARREMAEDYVKRIEKLEEIAMTHDGVERAFALHAGREIRVMVQPDAVGDDDIGPLSKKIAKRLEDGLRFPGKIKVLIVRETKAEEYAQ